ncbi:MAG: hypothetical protein N2506_01565, partial [Dehalococcoidales bacterium]|nr:hypothetical protein [Dehalococcoidales bacterium]
YVRVTIEGPASPQVLLPRIDQLAGMLRPYVQKDTEMFYSYEDWERCLNEDLRPPDVFEGWMAGGPSPPLPFFLHRSEVSALRREFGVSSLFELMAKALTPEDVAKLKDCLTPETYELFLLNYYGPLKAPQPPRQPGFGPNSLGLKSFITARYESVLKQLNGELPASRGDGSGNGASMWMSDMFAPPQRPR